MSDQALTLSYFPLCVSVHRHQQATVQEPRYVHLLLNDSATRRSPSSPIHHMT
uniref:Uncharacterized protein n=1 Tax=Anguilla anguilla TaxID=7936 RepID=A0A0E9XBH0_ANGAN